MRDDIPQGWSTCPSDHRTLPTDEEICNRMAAALSSSSWEELFSVEFCGSTLLEPITTQESPSVDFPTEVEISQRNSSRNRRFEACFQTDIVMVCGETPDCSGLTPYTRMFEAVGDWVPNMAIRDGQSDPIYILPKRYAVLDSHQSVKLSRREDPPKEGHVRYNLMCGKSVDLLCEGRAPPFLRIKGMHILDHYDGFCYRSDLEYAEAKSQSRYQDVPWTPKQLFEFAVGRAKAENRGLQLMPYGMPTSDYIGDSPEAIQFLNQNWPDSVHLCTQSSSFGEAIGNIAESIGGLLEAGQLSSLMSDEEKELWQTFVDLYIVNRQEAEYEGIHKRLLEILSNGRIEETDYSVTLLGTFLKRRNQILHHNPQLDHVFFDGKRYGLSIHDLGSFEVPYGYTFVPYGSSATAVKLLSGLSSLENVTYRYVEFDACFDYYADSVQPRRPSEMRGIMLPHDVFWQERLKAKVRYEGVWFHCSIVEDKVTQSYVTAFNTMILQDFVRRRSQPHLLILGAPSPGIVLPQRFPVPPYLDGLGIWDDRVTASPLMTTADWKLSRAPDLRLLLPTQLIELLLLKGTDVFVPDLEGVVQRGEAPRVLRRRALREPQVYDLYGQEFQELYQELMHPPLDLPSRPGPDSRHFHSFRRAKCLDRNNVWCNARGEWVAKEQMAYKAGQWSLWRDFALGRGASRDYVNRVYSVFWQDANNVVRTPLVSHVHSLWRDSLAGAPKEGGWYQEVGLGEYVKSEYSLFVDHEGYPMLTGAENELCIAGRPGMYCAFSEED